MNSILRRGVGRVGGGHGSAGGWADEVGHGVREYWRGDCWDDGTSEVEVDFAREVGCVKGTTLMFFCWTALLMSPRRSEECGLIACSCYIQQLPSFRLREGNQGGAVSIRFML